MHEGEGESERAWAVERWSDGWVGTRRSTLQLTVHTNAWAASQASRLVVVDRNEFTLGCTLCMVDIPIEALYIFS